MFARLPDPGSHAFPDYSLPEGDPVMPIAVTRAELSAILDCYEAFRAVDPTGLDSNPVIEAAVETLYDIHQRVTEQEVYFKRPSSALE